MKKRYRITFWFSAKQKRGLEEIAEICLLKEGKELPHTFYLKIGKRLVEFTQPEMGENIPSKCIWDDKQLVAIIPNNPNPAIVLKNGQHTLLREYFN